MYLGPKKYTSFTSYMLKKMDRSVDQQKFLFYLYLFDWRENVNLALSVNKSVEERKSF